MSKFSIKTTTIYALSVIFAILLIPFGLLFHIARFLKLPVASWFLWLDPSQRKLIEALRAYGFSIDDKNVRERDYVMVTPDKFLYLFTVKAQPDTILILLVEDYISSLDYVKKCFSTEIDAQLITLHKVIKSSYSSNFEDRAPVKSATSYSPPNDWDELRDFAIDYPSFYFGFLATVKPDDPTKFWAELHEKLDYSSPCE